MPSSGLFPPEKYKDFPQWWPSAYAQSLGSFTAEGDLIAS